jgi:hypothetical protein
MPGVFVTQIFFGIEPTADGLRVMPALPEEWNGASIRSLRIRGRRVSVHIVRHPQAEATRAKVDDRPRPVEGGHGVFVPRDQAGRELAVEIVQPARIVETHRPPWPLPDLDRPPVPAHPRVTDQALINATRADSGRARRELGR